MTKCSWGFELTTLLELALYCFCFECVVLVLLQFFDPALMCYSGADFIQSSSFTNERS